MRQSCRLPIQMTRQLWSQRNSCPTTRFQRCFAAQIEEVGVSLCIVAYAPLLKDPQLPGSVHHKHTASTSMSARHTCIQYVSSDFSGPITQPYTASTQQLPLLHANHAKPDDHDHDLTHCKAVLQQLNAVGWDKVVYVSHRLNSIRLSLKDSAGRLHKADVLLPPGFPVAAPSVSAQLPVPFKVRWMPGDSLETLVQNFAKVLEGYQPLWEQLEDLDIHAQVLDPPATLTQPYSRCSRCIALGKGVSCQIKLSPTAARALPSSLLFQGPSSQVASLQTSWYSSAHKLWQEQASVRDNLQHILQLTLPAPKPGIKRGCAAVLAAVQGGVACRHSAGPEAAAAVEAETVEPMDGNDIDNIDSDDDDDGRDVGACAICYALHLPNPGKPDELGVAPSTTCTTALCGRVFHAACLAEWLGALPSSRRVFDTIFGSCPFCQNPIGVSAKPGN